MAMSTGSIAPFITSVIGQNNDDDVDDEDKEEKEEKTEKTKDGRKKK